MPPFPSSCGLITVVIYLAISEKTITMFDKNSSELSTIHIISGDFGVRCSQTGADSAQRQNIFGLANENVNRAHIGQGVKVIARVSETL